MLETVTREREIASALERHPTGHVHDVLTGMLEQHNRNKRRRTAVLAHEDLRARLERELGYTRADQWNGYIPPATVNEFSTDEMCQSRKTDRAVRFNQFGRYGIGEMPNDSPRRHILLELSAEAWTRRTV